MKLLNLGCGSTHHPAWTNVDMISTSPEVLACDLSRPLPFSDGQFDAVYNSHVLEHFARADAEPFLREALRVLRPGGIIRVVVPDFERLTREYLNRLEAALAGDRAAEHDYDWLLIELFDQTVRRVSGGEMKDYLARKPVPNLEFVRNRIGAEADGLLAEPAPRKPLFHRLKGKSFRRLGGLARDRSLKLMARAIGGRAAEASVAEGLFRSGGEVHKWMYDRFSLKRLLEKAGAVDVQVRGAAESGIQNFASFGLDTIAGKTRKPDSLFMEARKP